MGTVTWIYQPYPEPNEGEAWYTGLQERVRHPVTRSELGRPCIFPPSCSCYVGHRQVLSFSSPLAPVGVPQAVTQTWQTSVFFCHSKPLVELVVVHELVWLALAREHPTSHGTELALEVAQLVGQ